MKEFILVGGHIALVDDDDYAWLAQWRWYRHSAGYAIRRDPKPFQLMHRLILCPPHGYEVDHINGNKLDNRRANIRICTTMENQRNSKPRTDGTSRFKGVSFDKRYAAWRTDIRVNKVKLRLGTYESEVEAAYAYDRAARMYFGSFAKTNFD